MKSTLPGPEDGSAGQDVPTVVRVQESEIKAHSHPAMSSSTPNTSKSEENATKTQDKPKSEDVPHLGVLEEDDEFEEFECTDWDDSQTDLAHLNGTAPGVASSSGDKLWEDNWDDDDIEDDFSVQLRNELAKTGKVDAMQH